ncbi:MAG: hypothetical protein VB092_04225 [Oscillospiraceae bacterium]|nr:hypothetical protein [Oscillospiraceae bacterium]
MKENEKLLMSIHKNAEMGRNTIDKLIPEVADETFKGLLESQHDEYSRVFTAADVLLKKIDGDDRGVPPMAKTMGNVMIELSTLSDHSTAKLAEMVLKGTDKGIEELAEAMAAFSVHAKQETLNLAEMFDELLRRNRHELKKYTE